jgi:glutamyl-tRNA reductase
MALRYDPAESYDSWLSRIQDHELKLARQKLASGEPVDQVMEEFSQNLVKKMLHPILADIATPRKNYDMEESRARYERVMKHVGPAADQVDSNT